MHKGVELLKTYADFILSIESNEIAVIEFDHYRKYIQFQIEDFKELIRKFETYFNKLNLDALNSLDVFSEFKAKCDSLFEMSCTIQSYLFDYRILLMNSFLEDVFKKKVPERETRDSKYKLLTEVAKKEEVEKEEKKREEAAIRRKKDNGKSA